MHLKKLKMITKNIGTPLKILSYCISFSLLWSCNSDNEITTENRTTNTPIAEQNSSLPEQAFPNTFGTIKDVTYRSQEIKIEEIQGAFFLEGDIMIPIKETNLDNKSVGRSDEAYLWPKNIVPYQIDKNVYDATIIEDAIDHWRTSTTLQFVERKSETDYVVFTAGSGCSSAVGRQGEKQYITVSSSCTVGNIIHEIGHAIGLWHEQARMDAEQYITIHQENIKTGKEHNFKSYIDLGYDGVAYTDALDFESIMMYDSYSFSNNGHPTITKKDGSIFQSQRYYLSDNDLKGIAKMYPKIGQEKKTISLLANNNRYLSSEGGLKNITANRTLIKTWETFEIIPLDNGYFAFKASNGKYMSSENGLKPMTCNREKLGEWEKFKLEQKSGNQYYIKGNNGRYVSSNDGDETLGLTCDRVEKKEWELFTLIGL